MWLLTACVVAIFKSPIPAEKQAFAQRMAAPGIWSLPETIKALLFVDLLAFGAGEGRVEKKSLLLQVCLI